MDKVFSVLFPLLYAGIAFLFFRGCLNRLRDYWDTEKRPYEIVPGTVADFELQYVRRARRGSSLSKVPVFYPVFQYQWKGKTRRGYGRRVRARIGSGFQPVPATGLQIGDSVSIRVIQGKLKASRMEEPHWFWRSRIWVSALGALISGAMILAGLYWALCALLPW